MNVGTETSTYVASFERFQASLDTTGPSWVGQLRRAGIASFARTGFPTTREERWRTTSVAPIATREFVPAGAGRADEVRGEAARAGLGIERAIRLVFVNGRFSNTLSSAHAL